jgi:hypothetical protein
VLALFHDLKSQAPKNLEDEFSQLTHTKTAMVCKLALIPPDMWLLNERNRQRIEDEKAKKAATMGDRNSVKFSDKNPKDVNIPNQYAKVKSVAKGEEMIEEDTEQSYDFVDEFLEEGT